MTLINCSTPSYPPLNNALRYNTPPHYVPTSGAPAATPSYSALPPPAPTPQWSSSSSSSVPVPTPVHYDDDDDPFAIVASTAVSSGMKAPATSATTTGVSHEMTTGISNTIGSGFSSSPPHLSSSSYTAPLPTAEPTGDPLPSLPHCDDLPSL